MDYWNIGYICNPRTSQGTKQHIAEKIAIDEKNEKTLKTLSAFQITSQERAEKKTMLNRGIAFAYSDVNGNKFGTLSEDIREHRFFKKGYEIGNKRMRIKGSDCFLKGLSIEECPEEDREHHEFIAGYEAAKERHLNSGKPKTKKLVKELI